MSTAPRTPDDGRNERQRQHNEDALSDKKRVPDDGRKRFAREGDADERTRLLDEKPFDFIERTKPEDRLDQTDHPGQLTRDNVNPAIPSAPPRAEGGEIVDPKSLGMEGQAGVAPPRAVNQPEQWPKRDEVTGQAAPSQRHASSTPEGEIAQALHLSSINEPPGSVVIPGDTGPVNPDNLPPLVLSDIDPDSIIVGSAQDFVLTVTGSGFGPNCVVMFDDEEYETTGDQTTLTASIPVAAEAGVVDVEVARGEELSDVLSFEFVAPAGTRKSEKAERKPKKETPRSKRTKKGKR